MRSILQGTGKLVAWDTAVDKTDEVLTEFRIIEAGGELIRK
jgi:hypothetical protein